MLTSQDATAMEDTTLKYGTLNCIFTLETEYQHFNILSSRIIQSTLKYASSLCESKTAAPLEGKKFWQIMINKTYQFVGKVS